MLGVVIWSCQRTGRAIVWCSDHRDLAHYDGSAPGKPPARIDVGDLVEMAFVEDCSVRRCTDLRVIEQGYMPDVVSELRGRRTAIAAA